MNKNIKKNIFIVLFFTAISLSPMSLYLGNRVLGHGDHARAIDFSSFLMTTVSGWRDHDNTGQLEYALEGHLPFSIYFLTIGKILNNVVAQKLWLFITMFLPAVFMYKFLKAFFKENIPEIFIIGSSVFYIINPFIMDFPIGLNVTKFPVYLGLPLSSYLIVKYFESENWREKYRYIIYFALSTILIGSSFRNIAELAPYIFIVLSLIVFYFTRKEFLSKLKHLVFFVSSILLSFLFNFWWIYSSFVNRISLKDQFVQGVASFSTQTKFYDAARLFGNWGLRAGHRDFPYYLYGEFYYSIFGFILTYLLVILFLFPLFLFIFNKKDRNLFRTKNKFFFLILIGICGIFFVKGASGPFGFWYIYLYDNFKYFRIFRESYAKFSLITLFAYTSVFAYSLFIINELIKEKLKFSKYYLTVVYLILIGAVSFPFYNGQIIRDYTNGVIKQTSVIVPRYWLELREHTEGSGFNNEKRVLTFPRNGIYGNSYLWESGFTGRPAEIFVNANTVFDRELAPSNRGDEVVDILYNSLEKFSLENDEAAKNRILNLFRLLNVGYILQQNDLDWRNLNYPQKNIWSVENSNLLLDKLSEYVSNRKVFGYLDKAYLEKIPYISGEGRFVHRVSTDPVLADYVLELEGRNALILDELNPQLDLPKIYLAEDLINFNTKEDFESILSDKEILNKKIALTNNFSLTDVDAPLNVNNKILKVEKNSSARYKITLSVDTKGPILIVFNESFDEGWKLRSACSFVCSGEIKAAHFEANYYANAWYMKDSKHQTFYIAHTSDDRLYIGVLTSLIALSGSIYLIYLTFRKPR